MDFMIMFFSICSVIGIGILIWFKTKSGKDGSLIYDIECL